ncbi:MAG: hypothetical protein M1823_002196 [Watsoniomyces obsoletus]|nr:MAG: hypothetical protein M1823_002196 [Watsoniomyces obsoletus]
MAQPVVDALPEGVSPSEEALVTPPDSPSPSPSPASAPTQSPRLPSLRTTSDPPVLPPMTVSSTPLGTLNAARRPGPAQQPSAASIRTGGLTQDMQARLKAFHLSRQGAPPTTGLRMPTGASMQHAHSSMDVVGSPDGKAAPGGILGGPGPTSPTGAAGPLAGGFNPARLVPPTRPHPPNWTSAPVVAGARRAPKPSLGARRGLQLPGGLPGALSGTGTPPNGTSDRNGNQATSSEGDKPNGVASAAVAAAAADGKPVVIESGSLFNKFSEYVDTKTGSLKFAGKAVIHGKGIDFSGGSSFSISLDEVENLEELGKGNYGTVYRVRHSRPQMRRPGLGLKGNRRHPSLSAATGVNNINNNSNNSSPTARAPNECAVVEESPTDTSPDGLASLSSSQTQASGKTSGIIMAMKEIHLELDEAKFAAIIMELDVLHRCTSPFIVDFYGAFFQEGAVYICMEFMDGGSVDKLYGDGIPEPVLRKMALSTVMGLKTLKDDHNIIHRDVKPTNILVNTRGQVKICDFGVSGNLVASIAKTNIGCQSYMAPERIASGGVAQAGANPGGGTYSVQSDIWSLGLTIIECAMGRYPYAPETYHNIFSQLSAIVDGEPPDLPQDGFTPVARDFVRGCLNKIPKLRPTYAMLLRHPWLSELLKPPTIAEADETAETPSPHLPSSDHVPTSGDTTDEEVAQWVRDALDKRRRGVMGKKDKPALHAAPLDARAPATP